MRKLCLALAICAFPVSAQTIEQQVLPSLDEQLGIIGITTENRSMEILNSNGDPILQNSETDPSLGNIETQTEEQVTLASGAMLRGLDRVSTDLKDFELATGEHFLFGPLLVTLKECRYPRDNPSGDAFAYLTIEDRLLGSLVFEGWMIESSPALNALDHSRYDVWLLGCKTPSGSETPPAK